MIKCVDCSEPAEIILNGNSYCNTHSQGKKTDLDYNGRPLYITGLGLWFVAWVLLFLANVQWKLNLFGEPKFSSFFVIPLALGTISLGANAYLSRSQTFSNYETEVEVIEFVERNSSWFLIGSSAIFAWATLASQYLHLSIPAVPFIIYITLCLIFLSPVILLYWIPESKPRNLGRLRHWKTIPFTFAVSFFAAAVITLLVGVLST